MDRGGTIGFGQYKGGKPTQDPEAGWHVKNDSRGNRQAVYGFSVHTAVDEDGFIHSQSVTPDNAHDSQERDTLLLGDETALYVDANYSRPKQIQWTLSKLSMEDQVQHKGYRGKSLSKKERTYN
ncbi:MAG: transposase [Endozoicomonadaceae bacterium]|nr:transposase [Endozoicomonadaceae bacterium]